MTKGKQGDRVEKVGKVSVDVHSGSYRLRYRVDGERKSLTISGGITKETQAIALQVAGTLNTDIVLGQYDHSKAKYDRRYQPIVKVESYNLLDLWEMYKRVKANDTRKSSQKTLWTMVDNALLKVNKSLLALNKSIELVDELRKHYSNASLAKVGVLIRASINLAVKYERLDKVTHYPFPENTKAGSQSKKTYSTKEIKRIIQAFDSNEFSDTGKHSYYARFVEFVALMGRRPEDIIALTWNDLIEGDGRTFLRIDKAYTKGYLQPTKNDTITTYPLNREMLSCLERQGKITNKYNLIFPSVTGGYILQANFTRREWNTVIDGLVSKGELKERYRFYNLRHSRATDLLRKGVDLETISSLIETSPKMLSEHYLQGNESIELPEMF